MTASRVASFRLHPTIRTTSAVHRKRSHLGRETLDFSVPWFCLFSFLVVDLLEIIRLIDMAPPASSKLNLQKLTSQLFHLQLPLTPRQQDQLLTLLTSTFHTHLEKRYGSLPSDPSHPSIRRKQSDLNALPHSRPSHPLVSKRAANGSSTALLEKHSLHSPSVANPRSTSGQSDKQTITAPVRSRRQQSPSRSRTASLTATDSHLHSILSNPLFNTKAVPERKNRFGKKNAVDPLPDANSVYSMMSDPDAWFRGLVASGAADTTSACFYLESVSWKSATVNSSTDPKSSSINPSQLVDSVARSNAAEEVLNWIWSSNQVETNLTFFKSDRLALFLGRFMGASHNGGSVTHWLLSNDFNSDVARSGFHNHRNVDKWCGMIFSGVVEAYLARDPSGALALAFISRLTTKLIPGGLSSYPLVVLKKPNFDRSLHYPVVQYIKQLTTSHKISASNTPDSSLRSDPVSPQLIADYDSLIANMRIYTLNVELYTYLLRALHPTRPDPDPMPGYQYLTSTAHTSIPGYVLSMPRLTLGLIVAGRFMAAGDPDKAEEVLALVLTHVGDYVSADSEGLPDNHGSVLQMISDDIKGNGTKREQVNLAVLERLFA